MSRRFAPLILALLTGACTMAPKYERPEGAVPPVFPTGEAYPALATEEPPAIDRAQIFRDPRLQQVIAQALENNRDLRVAAANIVRARSQFRTQRAALVPQVDASVQIQRTENNIIAGTTASANASLASYELDLFGRVQSLTRAAQERYFATEAAARATRLALISEIAGAWLDYAADKSLLTLAESTAASAERTVALTRARLEGGIAARTDLAQATTILATAQSDVARQRTAIAQDVNALTLLVGAPVDAAQLPGAIEEAAATVGEPALTMDSAILLRRPDVLGAEYELRAANADIGAARAALFPRITLTALFGLVSGSLDGLFNSDGRSVTQGSAGINYPIFRAGAGRATVNASKAQRDAMLATYEKAIQTAFREVADALARRGTIDEQLAADTRRTDAADDNFKLAEARYRGGINDFLQNLDAQRSLYTAQRVLVASRLEAAQNRVSLYRVIGGDALTPAPGEPEAR